MPIEKDIRDVLKDDASVASVVGTAIYPQEIPQDYPLPAITYHRSGNEPQYALDGETTLKNPQFAIDIWCESYEQARTLTDYVKAAMGAESSRFTAVQTTEFEIYEDDSGVHHISLDYSVWHN
jgi:hypothetical protein